MTNDSVDSRRPAQPEGRTFMLCAGFFGTVIGGFWLGFMVALVTGIVSADPPLFPGEYLAATLLSLILLVGLYVLVRRADVRRLVTLGLLFVAAIAVLDVLCALFLLTPLNTICILPSPDVGPSARSDTRLVTFQDALPSRCRPSPPVTSAPVFWAVLAPSVLVATLLCSSAVRRSALLQLAGLAAGVLFTLSGLLLSLARVFT